MRGGAWLAREFFSTAGRSARDHGGSEMARRFIVRFRGSAPAKEIASKLHADALVHVVEETSKMLLVEADEANLLHVVQPGPDVRDRARAALRTTRRAPVESSPIGSSPRNR